MIINHSPDIGVTYIYPFAESQADTVWQDRIAIHYNGNVVWNSKTCTPESWIDYMAQMNAAMSKAFEIQRSKQ